MPARGQELADDPGELQRIVLSLPTASTPELEIAREELRELVDRAAAADASAIWAGGLLHLAWVAAELGDPDESRRTLERLRSSPGDLEEWETDHVLGLIEGSIAGGALERALGAADWALAEVARSPVNRARVQIEKQWLLRALGEHVEADAALDSLEAEVELLRRTDGFPEAGLHYFEACSGLGRAQKWLSLGVLDRAAAELDQALSSARRSGHRSTQLAAALAHSDMSLLQGRRDIALQVIDRFLEQNAAQLTPWERANASLQRAVALSELARLEADMRAPAESSLRALLAAPSGRGDLVTRARLELVDLLLRDGPDDAERIEAGQLLAAAEGDLGDRGGLETVALAASLRARFVLAGEPTELELERAGVAARAAFERLLEEWRSAPTQRRAGVGFLHVSYRRQLISGLVNLTLARDPSSAGRARALAVLLAAQAEGALVADLGGRPVDLAELRERYLGQRHGCLLLLPGRHETHLFAFDRESILHAHLPARVSLLPTIDSFQRALFAPPERRERDGGALLRGLVTDAAALSDALFDDPIRARIATWKHVTVVGTELFKGLPVECLPLLPKGELLGLTHAVDVVPSLPLAARIHAIAAEDQRAGEIDLVFVGDLDPARPEAGMQIVAQEDLRRGLVPLLEPFDELRRVVLLGENARWPRVVATLTEREPAILHLLAHGSYDPDRERGAYLALRGGRVFAEQIEALEGCGRLVVLSACATARGPERFGSDNLTHLGGAFVRAGARCVILTRARILLGRTLRLDRALHEALAEGHSVAEALRRARVAAVDEDPFSPYLVGRVQAYGLGSTRLFERQ